jgi:hypothetical protein
MEKQDRNLTTDDLARSDEGQRDEGQRDQGQLDQGQHADRQELEPAQQRDRQTQTMDRPGAQSSNGGLLQSQDTEQYAAQWTKIQAAFVDEPRKAVEEADKLVAEIIQRLAKTFADERHNLEGQWSRGDQASTEDLRVALQRYRQFFQSLLRT